MTRRIRLTVEYDGTAYAGWQRQINAVSVQQRLEEAVFKLTGEEAGVTGASRTDAGVHALGQVAHFDTSSRIPGDKFCFALNTVLPDDIRVSASCETRPDFHARFDAKGKLYRYLIHNHAHACAIERNTHAHAIYPLDEDLMHGEAQSAVGTPRFCRVRGQRLHRQGHRAHGPRGAGAQGWERSGVPRPGAAGSSTTWCGSSRAR